MNKLLLLGSLQIHLFVFIDGIPNNTADQLCNDLCKINRGHSNEKLALILIFFSKPLKYYLVAKIRLLTILQLISMILQLIKSYNNIIYLKIK